MTQPTSASSSSASETPVPASGSNAVYDLVIIGAGPAGYTGAIRAAQLGLRVACVEKEKTLGGTCLNVGCIPSKALLESSEHFAAARHGEMNQHGIKMANVELDLPQMMSRKNKIVQELTGGISYLFQKNKIDWIKGTAQFISAQEIQVTDSATGGSRQIQGHNFMIATGSIPVELPFLKFDQKRILSSTEALSLSEVPKHLVVVGGGVIGLELGSVWARLGAKVTVVEFSPTIVGGVADRVAADALLKSLKRQGMEFLLSSRVTSSELKDKTVILEYEDLASQKKEKIEADYVLVAVGRRPYTQGLGLDKIGLTPDQRGCVAINDHFQTHVPNIYAVGDVVRGPMLAHKAEEEGVAVAEIVAGRAGHVNYNTVPSVIYTMPELAWVGQTEENLKEKGIAYRSGQFPFKANGRAKALGMTDGFCKILADAKTDQILGVHIIGPRASDLLGEAIVAMEFSGTSEDLARSFHSHPTLTEVIREAALAVDRRARQM